MRCRTLLATITLALPATAAAHDTTDVNVVNNNLMRLAVCETNANPQHWTRSYEGMLGFTHRTWAHYRHYVHPTPPVRAPDATLHQQLAVGRVLVRLYGYAPWPTCSIRLGLRHG